MLTVGSLFAGIGGFDLGFERAGFEIRWQVEIDPWCRAVLAKHWPDVRRYDDVRTIGDDLERVDVVCGGFPCQNISSSGTKAGIDGPQSGLWREFARIIRGIRPRYIVVENVADLVARGLGRVLGDLATCGYDADWESLPIALFGAPHLRARTVVVGYAHEESQSNRAVDDPETSRMSPVVANAEHAWRAQRRALGRAWGSHQSIPWDADGQCLDPTLAIRMDDGLSDRMDRLRGLGNSMCPQIAEWIARRILEAEGVTHAETR